MTNPKAGGWIGGAAVVAIIIALVAWFAAISPTLATASDTRAQTEAQTTQNALTKVKTEALKKQAANLDAIKGDLAAARLQIPTSHDEAEFQRELIAIASARSVTITSVAVSPSTPLVAAAAPAATPAPTATADASTSETAAAPAAAAGSTGLYSLATTINVVGSYQNVTAFLQDLQSGIQRLFLVTGLTGTSQSAADASGGKPRTVQGDLELVISGSMYVLTDAAAALAAPETATTPPVLPVPDPAKNPFLPLG